MYRRKKSPQEGENQKICKNIFYMINYTQIPLNMKLLQGYYVLPKLKFPQVVQSEFEKLDLKSSLQL